MGKKGRKTRWRTLAITGESDSEDSSTLTGSQITRTYHKPYFSKFSYSSQSTPTRRYQHDAKSTRSSSTASENKITFNEDEYTKITTPRQDVLFKKGYLNKPKNYQTQTSTGNSTTSTGNSTGNGTPDHQSADGAEGTDLEYESQFVFPNGFVDQNGIYYINSFEPYPLVMYNPPICYPEYPSPRTKRYSTDSMTESTSPHNEDASQDLSQSGGETAGNPPEYSQQMYNVVYTAPTGYYFNGVCGPNALANGHSSTEPRRIKKKRRRKISKSATHDGTTSTDDCESSDEAVTQVERVTEDAPELSEDDPAQAENSENDQPLPAASPTADDDSTARTHIESSEETKNPEDATKTCSVQPASQASSDPTQDEASSKFNLNAEEFIPRAYRNATPDQHTNNLQFVNIHPNFIPIPLLSPLSELPPPAHPAFLPPGIPFNFTMPPDPKLLPPNFVNFYVPKPTNTENNIVAPEGAKQNEETKKEEKDDVKKPEAQDTQCMVKLEVSKINYKNNIDIAKIVSKLEEAAKEQRLHENKRNNLRFYNKFNKGQRFSDFRAAKMRPKKAEDIRKKDEEIQTNISSSDHTPSFTSPRRFGRGAAPITSPNYSDTLKKISPGGGQNGANATTPKTICPRFGRHIERSAKPSPSEKERVPQQKSSPNQWISVSNRKKRKYKNADDKDDDMLEEVEDDVTPAPPLEEIEEQKTNENSTPDQIKPIEEEQLPAAKEEERSAKKKSKKGTQKPLIKRIIIVDATPPEVEEVKKDVVEEIPPKKTEVETSPEKKKVKKKKKPAKQLPTTPPMVKSPSVSGSLNALNDDTYDFLLDTSVLEEKTNLEISEELDKMIQKGMYSNLEEKIKLMSVSPVSDDFFRSISFKRPPSEVTSANNFSALLKNTGRILSAFKPPVSVEEHKKIDLDFNKIRLPEDVTPPKPSTSKSGDFLEQKAEANHNSKSNGKLKNKSKKKLEETAPKENQNIEVESSQEPNCKEDTPSEAPRSSKTLELDLRDEKWCSSNHDEVEPKVVEEIGLKTLYPITQAVKEWMTKTRENTPEVELLKSPDTIYREFIEEDAIDEEESDLDMSGDSKNVNSNPFPSICEEEGERVADGKERKEEIMIYESWEEETPKANGQIEKGEDVLEIYDLKVKVANLPKHGNLPYRAICCNLIPTSPPSSWTA